MSKSIVLFILTLFKFSKNTFEKAEITHNPQQPQPLSNLLFFLWGLGISPVQLSPSSRGPPAPSCGGLPCSRDPGPVPCSVPGKVGMCAADVELPGGDRADPRGSQEPPGREGQGKGDLKFPWGISVPSLLLALGQDRENLPPAALSVGQALIQRGADQGAPLPWH